MAAEDKGGRERERERERNRRREREGGVYPAFFRKPFP
jgi:hypothetical protein